MTLLKAGEYKCVNNQKFIYGRNSVLRIVDELRKHNVKRALVVTNKSITNTPYIKKIKDLLGQNLVALFTDSKQNSPINTIDEGLECFLQSQADCIIGLGGGSAIDTAKGIILKNKFGNLEQSKGLAKKKDGSLKIEVNNDFLQTKKEVPIFLIPTTLSGAEFTLQAGLTDETGRKDQYYDNSILADCVIMDPELALCTPYNLFMSTGIKALDHNIERLYAKKSHPLTDAVALKACKLLFEFLPKYQKNTKDLDVIATLQYASWMSQFTYGNVNVGVGHAIDHQLCALANIPHGIAACIMLPHAMEFNKTEAAHKLESLADTLELKDRTADAAIDAVTNLISKLGITNKIRDTPVQKEHFQLLAERSLTDTALVGNPREIKGSFEIKSILESAW